MRGTNSPPRKPYPARMSSIKKRNLGTTVEIATKVESTARISLDEGRHFSKMSGDRTERRKDSDSQPQATLFFAVDVGQQPAFLGTAYRKREWR